MTLLRLALVSCIGLALTACSPADRPQLIVGGGLAMGMAMEKAEGLIDDGATLRDFSENSDTGYVARVHGGVQMTRGWAAIVELEYTDVTFDLNGEEADATELSTFASLRYALDVGLPVRPYVKAGAGYASSLEGEEDDSFGVKGAVGIQFDLSEAAAIYGEVQYVEYLSPSYSITGVGVDSESATVGVHGGVELKF